MKKLFILIVSVLTLVLSITLVAIKWNMIGGKSSAINDAKQTATVTVDYSKELGKFSPYIFGTTAAPYHQQSGYDLVKEAGFKMIGIQLPPEIRGSAVNDASKYDSVYFADMDKQVKATIDAGAMPIFNFACDTKPSSPADYAIYVTSIVKHYTQGWNNGFKYPEVKIFRFGNEPDRGDEWNGTQTEFFATYSAAAKALKAMNPNFILDVGEWMTPRKNKAETQQGVNAPNVPTSAGQPLMPEYNKNDVVTNWIPNFLVYAKAHDTPVDFVAIHAYSPLPYYAFWDNFRLVNEELKKYPGLSNLYDTPRLANNEWNLIVGDLWNNNHYMPIFDTAHAASMNIAEIINMVEQGVLMSTKYGGPFNGDRGGCHDFLLTDCNQQGKPSFYAFKGFNWLADSTRLSTEGTDHVNFAVISGKTDKEIIVVISNSDYKANMLAQGVADLATMPEKDYAGYVKQFGEPKVYCKFNLKLDNLPWTSSQKIIYERYLVDDTRKLELVKSKTLSGAGKMEISEDITAPSIQVIKLRVN